MSSRCPGSSAFAKTNRRCDKDRRTASDRRNLIRFEDLGNDRRAGLQRRDKEFDWDNRVYPDAAE